MPKTPRTDDLLPSHPGEPYPYPVSPRVEEKDIQGAVVPSTFAPGMVPVQIVSSLPTLPDPLFPQGYVVFLTSDNKLYRSTGTAWTVAVPTVDLTGQITSAQITDLAVTTAKLNDLAVSTAKIAALAVDTGKLAALAVDTSKIADLAVSTAKIAALAVDNGKIAALAVDSAKLADLAVTTAKLNDFSVQTAKLGNLAVTSGKIGNFEVSADKLRAAGFNLLENPGGEMGNVGWTTGAGMTVANDATNARTGSWCLRYATDGVGGPNFLNANTSIKVEAGDQVFASAWGKGVGSAGTSQLAIRWRDAAQTQIQRDVIGSWVGPVAAYTQVSGFATAPAGAVYAVLDLGENNSDNQATPWFFDDCVLMRAVTTGFIAAGAITTAKIAANAVTANEIAALTITAAQIAAATITGAKIAANTITAANITALTITAAEIAASTITGAKIAANTITAANITALTITATEIAAGTITGAKIAATTITASNIAALTITAAEIAASTITGAKIAALTITSGLLAADSVVAGKIAAKAIGVRELFVGSFDNLVLNPGLEMSASALDPWTPFLGGGTWSVVSSNVRSGANAAQYNPSGQSGLSHLQANGTNAVASHWAATEGDQFYLEAWVRAVGAGAVNKVQVLVYFRTASGGEISGTSCTAFTPTTSYQKISVVATAPATAAYVYFYVSVLNDGNAELINFDDVYARRMVTGSIVVDGTITAAKVAAHTITANEIAALTITAAEIAAGTITGGKIAATTITAANIAALTITAAEIAASTITGAKIAASTITAANIAALTITAAELAADSVTTNKILAGAVTAAKITVSTLSSIVADIGTITAGLLRDANSKYVEDLTNALLTITDNQGSPITRVKLGKIAGGTTDYGLQIFDKDAATVVDFTGAKRILAVPVQPSADSGTAITVDLSTGLTQQVRLTGTATVTLTNPTNGGRYRIWFQQDTTGSRPFPTVKGPNGEIVMYTNDTAPTLTATPGAMDLFEFEYRTSPSTRFTCMTLQTNVLLPTPQVQSVTASTFTTGTTHNVSMPATVNSGDLLLAALTVNTGVVTTPSGWTLVTSGISQAGVTLLLYAKAAGGTEGGTTVNFATDVNAQMVVHTYRITRWYGTTAGVTVSWANGSSSANPDPPNHSPGYTDRTLWLAIAAEANQPTISVYPTNYTNGTNNVSGAASGVSLGTSRRVALYASSDNPSTFTFSSVNAWCAGTIAVQPPQ